LIIITSYNLIINGRNSWWLAVVDCNDYDDYYGMIVVMIVMIDGADDCDGTIVIVLIVDGDG
jgi:hypothetical protein